MNFRSFIYISALLFIGITTSAIPAKKNFFSLRQPDGYTFNAVLTGDEFFHILKTTDGYAIARDDRGYFCYLCFDADGSRYNSGVPVGSPASASVLDASRNIPYKALSAKAIEKKFLVNEDNIPLTKRIAARLAATKSPDKKKHKHGIIILAQFNGTGATEKFQYTKGDFQNMLTQEGYALNGATGSALEYFTEQFGDGWEFSFDISEIITLPRNRAYYGANDNTGIGGGNDIRAGKMISDACTLADEYVDFSKYDDDGDGKVDNVFVFFAGEDEAEGYDEDLEDRIWSHAYYLSASGINLVLDGKIIDRYACTSELARISENEYVLAGIGTFCHEYSHTFGLPDLYDTDYGTEISASLWRNTSLMDSGNINNRGNTPPNYNAIEREILGLSEPEHLTTGEHTLEPINEKGRYLRLDTDTDGEYYLFECRDNSYGWDRYIGGKGMLIYHIDKSAGRKIYSEKFDLFTSPYDRWRIYNEINANPYHQCADLVEADGRNDKLLSTVETDIAGIFFPAGNNVFKETGTPEFKFWSGRYSPYSICDIALSGKNITFSVKVQEDYTPIAAKINISPKEIYQNDVRITWQSTITISGKKSYIKLSDRDEIEITPYNTGEYAAVLDRLEPNTEYVAEIYFKDNAGNPGPASQITFTTKRLPASHHQYPFIYLNNVARNSDKTFPAGSKLPLIVFNTSGSKSISWSFDDREIEREADGYYTVSESGILKVTINYEGGATDVVTKQIIVKDK